MIWSFGDKKLAKFSASFSCNFTHLPGMLRLNLSYSCVCHASPLYKILKIEKPRPKKTKKTRSS